MKRIIRLTESDLSRIVKRVIREQEESDLVGKTVNLYRTKEEKQEDFVYKFKIMALTLSTSGNAITIEGDDLDLVLNCTDSNGAFHMGSNRLMYNRNLYNTIKSKYCTTMRDKGGNVKTVPNADFASTGGNMGGMA